MAAKTVTVLIQMRTHFFWFVLAGLLLALWAQWRLRSAYRRWSTRAIAARPLTGAGAAREILDAAGLIDVPIKRTRGHLTDHYDPQKRALRLSDEVHDMDSLAAVGIAAHEAGHALQHQAAYAPLKFRMMLVPVTQFASSAVYGIILLSFFMGLAKLAGIAVGIFAIITLFQMVTLPVEFNASRRAKEKLLSLGLITARESAGVSRVLSGAAMTYVAAMVASLMELLHWALILRGDRD